MNIRKIIRDILPYSIVAEKKRNKFLDMYDEWKATGKDFSWDEECKFDTIISVEGFGATGASAIIDLVREYDGTAVLGTVDPEGSQTSVKEDAGEIDFVRYTGGLLQLEQAFDNSRTRNNFWNDALIKLYIDQVYDTSLFKKNKVLRPCFYKFLDEIVDIRIKDAEGNPYNPTMGRFYDKSDIFILKPLTLDQYITICKKMLNTIFNHFYNGKCKFLMLDQLFADCYGEINQFKKYVPNLKQIKSYRDPRDVYCIGQRLNLPWMPRESAERFILWTKAMYGNFKITSEDYLSISFDSLVLDYSTQVKRLETFLGLEESSHIRKRQCFNPDISIKSVKEWTREPQYSGEFEKIREAFPELCNE